MKRKSLGVSLVALLLLLATGAAVYTGTAGNSESNDAGIIYTSEHPISTLATLWNIQIDATSLVEGASDFCEIAEDDTATEGSIDAGLDIINNPPGFSPSVDVYLQNGGNALTRDCRFGPESHPTTKIFELIVSYTNTTFGATTTLEFSWNPADFGLTEYAHANLTVFGDTSTVLADMTTVGTYSFAATPTTYGYYIVLETAALPPGGDGSDCANAKVVAVPGGLTYVDSDSTCGLGDDYSDTDMGYYDGGEDIIYRLDVSSDSGVRVTVTSPDGWVGVGLFNDCPDVGSLLASDSGYSGPYTFDYTSLTAAGSPYYLMIDSWPSPDCVDFELTIEFIPYVPPQPGETCDDAIPVTEGLTSCPGAPLWYEFTYTGLATCDIMITSNLAGQMVDTRLYVYDACGGTEVAYADDDYSGYYNYASTVQFPGVPGTDYKIFWDPYWSSSPFDFEIEVICPPHDVGTKDITSPFGSILKGDVGLGWSLYDPASVIPDGPLEFDLGTPSTFTSLASGTLSFFGADWYDDTWYAVEHYSYGYGDLVTIDESTGAVSIVGSHGIDGYYEIVEGLAIDSSGNAYISTVDGSTIDGFLYEIDLATGATTLIGNMGYYNVMMGIAFDNDDNLYGISLGDSHLYEISTADASVTDIGYLGLDLSYAQDIAFDREDEVMYWAAYDSVKKGPAFGLAPEREGKASVGLYTIDLGSGLASYVGDFAGNPEIGGFAIPAEASSGGPACDPPGVYPVQAVVRNYGGYTESFDVTATITDVGLSTVIYTDTVSVVDLAAGAEVIVDFAMWDTFATAPFGGDFIVEVCTELIGDENPANDCDDEDGCIAAFTDPVADPNGPYTTGPGDDWTVTFDGSASYDTDAQGPAPDITSYEWDFGDGTTGTGMMPTHTYYAPENNVMVFTVTLTVTDNDGPDHEGTDTATTTVTVFAEDDDPPLIQIESPEEGANVNGNINVVWYAIDDKCPGGQNLPISLYYGQGSSVRLIEEDLFNNIDDERGEYTWNTGGLADGEYKLYAQCIDPMGQIASDSVMITVGNGNSGVMVSDVYIQDMSVDSSHFVKDGDDIVVSAGITGRVSEVDQVYADLSGFGRGTYVAADSFDGFVASWTLHNVICTPGDGEILVTVFAGDHSREGVIVADNTNPEISMENLGGLYLFNHRVLPLNTVIAIGSIDIGVSAVDEGSVDHVEYYVDGALVGSVSDAPYGWNCNLKSIGGHYTLSAVVFDGAGNQNTESQEITIFNLFGQDW